MEQDYLQFEPRVHDFGDDYHRPDSELYSNISEAVRNIRRKYRHFNDYAKAIRTIEAYLDSLIEKYGGVRNFKIALQLKTVKEFIPPIPKFRNTEENRLLSKYGMMISEKIFEVDYELSEDHMRRVECESRTSGNGLDVVESRRVYLPFAIDKKDTKILENEDAICDELEMLQRFSESKSTSKKKRKKSSRNLLKEAKRRKKLLEKASAPQTVSDAINDYNRDVMGLNDDDDRNGFTQYNGIVVPISEVENLAMVKTLQKAHLLGSHSLSTVNSKQLRRMIKKNTSSKKKKKKKRDDEDIDMDGFLDAYNSSEEFGTKFKAFEKEMAVFTSDQMNRGW